MGSDASVNNYNIINISVTSSYDDYSNPDPNSYYHNISLRHFAAEPLEMLDHHPKFKELCLEHCNPEAHYIEGILQFFVHNDKKRGLYHIRESSIGNNGTYLYGLLMLALGYYRKGKKYFDKLQWEEDISTSDHCWQRIKNSLRSLSVTMKMRWYVNMVNLWPRPNCHPRTTWL